MSVRILTGDCRDVLATLDAGSVHCCVTSPPYFGLRDYGVAGQMGLEPTPAEFIAGMVAVFREVRRVLRDDGTLWLNIGDSYAGSWGAQSRGDETAGNLEGSSMLHARQIATHLKGTNTGSLKRTPGLKPKDLMMIPARLAIALQDDGWYLRKDIIWHKPNAMPESVTDRPTSAHEYLFLLSKSPRYFYDAAAIREGAVAKNDHDMGGGRYAPPGQSAHTGTRRPRRRGVPPRHEQYGETCDQSGLDDVERGKGRNARSVWSIATQPFPEAHFATFPPELARRCILAGCPAGGTVLDPFGGAGTTGLVADRLQRNATLIELNPEYVAIASRRIRAGLGSVDSAAEDVLPAGPLFAPRAAE